MYVLVEAAQVIVLVDKIVQVLEVGQVLILVKKVALALGLIEEVDKVLALEEVVEGQKKTFMMKSMMKRRCNKIIIRNLKLYGENKSFRVILNH